MRSVLPADPGQREIGHTFSLSGPQFANNSSPVRGCAVRSALGCRGRGLARTGWAALISLSPPLCLLRICVR